MKDRRSVTIDSELIQYIDKKATKESRSFSNMIEVMIKKNKEEDEKR